MNTKFYLYVPLFFLLLFADKASSQLVVTSGATAATLAATLAGPGVTISAPTLTCPGVANGTFTSVGTPLAMTNGVVLTNGHSAACAGPEGALVSFSNGTAGDPAMAPFLPAGTATSDACILEFDMVAAGDSIGFNYQFGSEEYRNAVCSIYTDVFAFFISGPGIVGAPNIALVPGTNIPVEINSVNNGGLGTVGGAAHVNCTSLGAGSPFTAYYIDNTGGTRMSYRGYTTKFRAVHAVTPCATYHLKLSIVDAGNALYDSGVFLEGASLTTNTYSFDHTAALGATVNGVPHTIVKGCSPATVTIDAAHPDATATTLNLTFGGTAVNGVDVTTVPGTITLPAGSTSVSFNVQAIPTPPGGSKTFTIYLQGTCGVVDSVTLNIMDTPSAYILTPDTTICAGQSFQIRAEGTTGLAYSWAPVTGLSSSTVMQPFASPGTTTTYVMTATLPGSGCPPIVRSVVVSVLTVTVNILTPDTSICSGATVHLIVNGPTLDLYSWSPPGGLSNPNVMDPFASPTVTTTYTVTATSVGGGCTATDSVTITVFPSSIAIATPPTTICLGGSVSLLATSTVTGMTYSWSPAGSLDNAGIPNPVATPGVTTTYTVTGSISGGLCPAVASVTITVANPTVFIITPDTSICSGASVNLNVTGNAGSVFSWTPAAGLSNASIINPIAAPLATTTYYVTASVPGSTCSAEDSITITVITPSVTVSPNTTICIGTSTMLTANGSAGMTYSWSPASSLNNPTAINPTATPAGTTTYTVTGTTASAGCQASAAVTITVANPQVSIITPDTSICAGKPVNIRVNGVPAYVYSWAPSYALDNVNVMQPVATPSVTTTYVVTVSYPGLPSCTNTAQFTVTLLPQLPVLASARVLSCNTVIDLNSSPAGTNYSYAWNGPAGFIANTEDTEITNVTAANQGTYSVTVVDNTTGCTGQGSAYAVINTSTNTHLTNVTPDQTIPWGTTIRLNADNAVFYWWLPNDGTISNRNINNPFVTPDATSTTYTVFGMDSVGCMDSAKIVVTLTTGEVDIPSGFTPNGDGLNDVFRPIGMANHKLVEFRVYNRWGQQLFYSNTVEQGWDGTFQGVPQDMDVYHYMMIIASPDGTNQFYKGNVTLIR